MSAPSSASPFAVLDAAGLNLQAVFDLSSLPATVCDGLRACVAGADYRQLILIAHAGPALWAALTAAGLRGADPIDDFSRATVDAWCRDTLGDPRRALLYPGDAPVGLQTLGALAGWHHPTPFMVGIQPGWGTWFGYRVALLADSNLPPTPPLQGASPCGACHARPCVRACPAGAMATGRFALERCLDWRLGEASNCEATCLARLACPVGQDQRYPEAQIRHSYGGALAMIRRYRAAQGA